MRKSASLARLNARLTPSASIGLSVSLSPAVSEIRTGNPAITVLIDTMSRVVPASEETIAASRRASAFNKLDLPALGRPIIATSTPCRMASPLSASASTFSMPSMTRFKWG